MTGTGDKPFAELGKAEVSVKLLPLLSRSVEMNTATLVGLQMNLVKGMDGKGNWQASPPASKASPTATGNNKSGGSDKSENNKAPLKIDIASVVADGLVLSYQDKSTGKVYTVDQTNLTTGAIRNREPFRFDLKARVSSNEPALAFQTSLSGHFSFDLQKGVYTLQNYQLSAHPDKPQGETVSLVGYVNYQQNPMQLDGEMDVKAFNPSLLLNQVNIVLQPMADPKAMNHLAFQSRFSSDGKSFNGEKLTLTLDKFAIDGHFKVTNLQTQATTFQFTGNDLNLDNYLPPANGETPKAGGGETASKPSPTSTSTSAEAPLIPEDALRSLTIKGSLKLNSLTVAKLLFEQPTVQLSGANGVQKVDIRSGFYKGNIDLNTRMDVRQKGKPSVSSNASLKGIELQAMTKAIPALVVY